MDRMGENHDEMWDSGDGFFYDLLHFPNGDAARLKIRSLVGLLPLCAASVFEAGTAKSHPRLMELIQLFRERHPEVAKKIGTAEDAEKGGYAGRRLAAVCNKEKLQHILTYMLDENEFLSPYGIRSLSRYHAEHPYVFRTGGQEFRVPYLPGESDSGMFGGNSNWRGPIWIPVNALIIRGLLQYYTFYGKDFTIECPTGSGRYMNLYQVAEDLSNRLASIFLRDRDGRRPVYGGAQKFQEDPHWRDLILFYEYFHGDNGAGLGASHQTGWTGVVARLMHLFATSTAEQFLELGKAAVAVDMEPATTGRSGGAAGSRGR